MRKERLKYFSFIDKEDLSFIYSNQNYCFSGQKSIIIVTI